MSSEDDQLSSFLNNNSVNEEFFSEIVEKKLNISRDKFKIIVVLVTPATGKNENYISVVLRSKIKVQFVDTEKCEMVDVIIKVSMESFEAVGELSVFQREQFVYENLLKSFEEMWVEKVGEKVTLGPRSLKFVASPNEIIVLDDLKAANYNMLDRKEGLNLEQTQVFLAKLAKFHAAGAVKFLKEGTIEDFLDRNCESAPKPDIENPFTAMFIKIYEEFLRALRSFGDCDYYADKIAKWDKFLVGTCFLHESKPMKCGLQVLNHGDVWTNNMMFKFDPLDVRMIDFQLCFWGSPSYDLLAFLILSVHDDIKVTRFDDIIEFYYDEFNESLVKLGYEGHIPSFDEFKDDLNEKRHIAATFLIFLYLAKYSSTEALSFEMLMRTTDENVLRKLFDNIYSDQILVKSTKIWLPFLDERGFLDTLIKVE